MSEEKMVRLNFGNKECQIFPYEHPVAPEVLRHYKKLELSPAEKAQLAALYQQIPSIMAAGTEIRGIWRCARRRRDCVEVRNPCDHFRAGRKRPIDVLFRNL